MGIWRNGIASTRKRHYACGWYGVAFCIEDLYVRSAVVGESWITMVGVLRPKSLWTDPEPFDLPYNHVDPEQGLGTI